MARQRLDFTAGPRVGLASSRPADAALALPHRAGGAARMAEGDVGLVEVLPSLQIKNTP